MHLCIELFQGLGGSLIIRFLVPCGKSKLILVVTVPLIHVEEPGDANLDWKSQSFPHGLSVTRFVIDLHSLVAEMQNCVKIDPQHVQGHVEMLDI